MNNIFESIFEESIFVKSKTNTVFLKMIHTHYRRSMFVWRLLGHRRASYIINLMSVCNFVSSMRIVSLSMKVISSPPV